MDLNSLLYSLGLSGFFASRAFLPAFASAFALKYGPSLPFLNKLDFIEKFNDAPTWFTSDYFVWGLGALALLELFADKSPEARELLDKGSVYIKTALSAATSFGLLSAGDAGAVEDIMSQADLWHTIPAALAAAATYFLSLTREGAVSILSEADEDDALGIRGLISWFEEIWALFGVWILLAIPVIMTAVIAAIFGLLWLVRKRHESKMEAAKIVCPSCSTRIHSFATKCYSCGTPVERPRAMSFLGGIQEERESDPIAQKTRLLELKRSPVSGEKAEGRGVDAVCAVDGVQLFGDPELTRRYLERVEGRLPKVMLFGALFGLIPGIGLIIGVIYYRFQLAAPFRRYLPWSRGFVTRWLIRVAFLALILLQFVPVLGAVAVPLMALINYRFYRSAFKSELREKGLLLES